MKKMKLLPLLTNKYNVFLFLKALLLIALLSLMSCSKRKIKEVFGAFSFSALEITVPEGFFVMGSRAGNPDERPERNIYISTFLIEGVIKAAIMIRMYNKGSEVHISTIL